MDRHFILPAPTCPRLGSALPAATLLAATLLVATLLAATLLTATLLATPAHAATPTAIEQISILIDEKISRTPTEHKVSSNLLLEYKRRRGDARLQSLGALELGITAEADGRVTLDLDLEGASGAAAGGTSEAQIDRLRQRIAAVKGEIVSLHPRFRAARVRIPFDRLLDLAALPDVRTLRPADRYMTQVTTEGDVAHGTNLVRADFGVDGSGVAVGAMSDSVDALGDLQASGELPGTVTVLPDQSGNPGSSEGTALLEIIHDMAPGSDLFFATGRGGQAQMAQNILDLQAAGCDVIVDDVTYFTEPAFQDGVIAQAVDAVADQGVVYVSSAGNSGNANDGTSGVFEGDYSGTTLPVSLTGAGLSAHDFGGGDPSTEIEVDTPFFIVLQWANPQDAATDDYDLYLLDSTLTNVIAASTTTQDGTQDPLEIIDSQARDDVGNELVVVKFGGDDAFLHLNTNRGEIADGTNGQIFGHAAARGAIAVAAIDVFTDGGDLFQGGPGVQIREFSSDGPRRIFFEPDGTPLLAERENGLLGPSPEIRDKPDVTAADGVSTSTPGFETFFGTSASAPHSAGIAALYKSRFGGVSADELRRQFFDSALDIEINGPDNDSGFGINMAPEPFDNTIFADGFESGNTASWTKN